MNFQVIFVCLEGQVVTFLFELFHHINSSDEGRDILAGLVESGRRGYGTDARNTSEINPSVVPLAEGCRDETMEQQGIVCGEISGKRVISRVVFYQFLVRVNPQVAIDVVFQLVYNVSGESAKLGMVGQLSGLHMQGIYSSLLCAHPDTGVFL